MDEEPYNKSKVLLFDAERHLRKQTRSILNNIGFWKIEEFENLDEARLSLSGRQYDLAIFAVLECNDGVAALVDDARRFRCGDDPFMPIILTSRDPNLGLVRTIIESGADDFLAHPFSTNDLSERIEVLVNNRKPYVVTEEYFGPDRRTKEARAGDAGSVEVPNALLARVAGRPELGPSSDAIEASLNQLRRVKMRNIARRIWAIADILYKAYDDPSLSDWIAREIHQILKSAGKFQETMPPREAEQLSRLCKSVVKMASRILHQLPSKKDLELLEQSALALRVAVQLGGDSSVVANEISDAVFGISSKNEDLKRAVTG